MAFPGRERLRDVVATVLREREDCLAAYEGGSAAFGRADAMSDVDVEILVEDGAVDAVVAAVLAAVSAAAPIARVWRRPELNIHGAHDCFVAFAGDPFVLVDLCVTERGRGWSPIDVERHGTPLPLFDRGGFIATTRGDPAARLASLRPTFETLAQKPEMFHGFVEKELLRGRRLDAIFFYRRLVLDPLVDLLRLRHNVAQHDFAGRYLHEVLPPAVSAALVELSVPTWDTLLACTARAMAMHRALVAELRALHGW